MKYIQLNSLDMLHFSFVWLNMERYVFAAMLFTVQLPEFVEAVKKSLLKFFKLFF